MTTASTPQRTYNPIRGSACVAPTFADDLDVLAAGIRGVIDQAASLGDGLSHAQFNWKPSPVAWSIAQCIKHLVLTGGMAAAEQEAAIARLRERNRRSDGPYTYGGIPAKMGAMLMGGIEPPVQRKFKTAKKVVPADEHDRDALIAEFTRVYERVGSNIAAAKGLDLGAANVRLPVPLFRMRLGQSLPFEIAHARRHLWQAEQVRASERFPA